MTRDLLQISDLEPPMGDLSIGHQLDTGRAVWRKRGRGEAGLPRNRIVHQRVLRLHCPARLDRLDRLGIRPALGFHKCASSLDRDWVVDFRLQVRSGGKWQEVLNCTGLAKPRDEVLRWFALPLGLVADAVIIEVRRSGLDGGWTSWNLVTGAFALEGELLGPIGARYERRLEVGSQTLDGLPAGVEAEISHGTVSYRTRDFSVGFRLDRPGFSHLGLAIEGAELSSRSLLLSNPVKCDQGPQIHAVGEVPRMAPAIRCDLTGTVRIKGGDVTYMVVSGVQRYELSWRVRKSGLTLGVTRRSKRVEHLWHSSEWTVGWDNAVSPTHAVGRMSEVGESGALHLPTWVNAPGFGTWLIESTDAAAGLRSECRRHADLHQLEFKVGEVAEASGLYRLPAGNFAATFRMRPVRPVPALKRQAPAIVKRALARTHLVAPTFRADIATLANSGASITCPICMDTWSAVLPKLVMPGEADGAPRGAELLRVSIERWLAGGPGYAAGRLSHGGKVHDADDEYLMTGAAILRAIGDYLRGHADAPWFRAHRGVILTKIAAAKRRDLDGDGLIESTHRTGTSGSGQWSTCWLDVLSFGWKCAWSNALLYGALRELAAGFRRFGEPKIASELRDWGQKLKSSYRGTFWNESTGGLAVCG